MSDIATEDGGFADSDVEDLDLDLDLPRRRQLPPSLWPLPVNARGRGAPSLPPPPLFDPPPPDARASSLPLYDGAGALLTPNEW